MLVRIAAYAQGIFMMSLFWFGYVAWVFYPMTVLTVLATGEELVLLFLLPEWTADVRGVLLGAEAPKFDRTLFRDGASLVLCPNLKFRFPDLQEDAGGVSGGHRVAGAGHRGQYAIFSVLDQLLLQKLPVHAPDELVNLTSNGGHAGQQLDQRRRRQRLPFSATRCSGTWKRSRPSLRESRAT